MCTNNKKDLKLKKLNKTSEHLQQKPILNKNKQNSNTKQEKELQLKILAIKKKINDIKLRSQANIENIRKQTTKKIEEIKKKSFIDFNSRLILIIDQLESIIKKLQIFNNKDNTIIQGLLLTMQSFLKATKKIGLIKEKTTETYFNPTIHEITAITEPKKNLKNHIVTILKPGYKLNNIILRKSIVKISNKNQENNIT